MSRRARLAAYWADNARAVTVGAAANALVYIPALRFAVTIVFAGAVGGWLAGFMTSRYGPSIRNGALAGLLGPLVTTVIVVGAGVLMLPLLGRTGVFESGLRLVKLAPVFAPLFAAEGAIGGLAASWFVTAGRR